MKKEFGNIMSHTLVSTMAVFFVFILTACSGKSTKQTNESKDKIMKKLVVNELRYEGQIDIDKAEELLESNTEVQMIATLNWAKYAYKPEVKFKIAYMQDMILMKFYVNEENIMAKETKINGDVYKDSCVEFFISPNQDDIYYNFEFNCIGTPHVGYGKAGTKRSLIDPEILKLIRIRSSLGNQPFDERKGGHQWEMTIMIPKDCFVFDKDIVFKELEANANFYKCGNDTSKPHFVTWNPVGTAVPDYHQPKYFGEISFK